MTWQPEHYFTASLTEFLRAEGKIPDGPVDLEAIVLFRTITIHPACQIFLDRNTAPVCTDEDRGTFETLLEGIDSAEATDKPVTHRGRIMTPSDVGQDRWIELLEQTYAETLADRDRPRRATPPTTPRAPAPASSRTRHAPLRAWLLGRDIDTHRRHRGITIRALADRIGITGHRCGEILHGRRTPTPEELDAFCDAFTLTEWDRVFLHARASETDSTHRLSSTEPWDPLRYQDLRALEPLAETITTHDTIHIPHTLRTDAYHRALLDTLTTVPATRRAFMVTDLHHHRTARPITTHYIHAHALTNPALPRPVLHEQITHLRDAGDTTIRILPDIAPPPTPHPFRLLTIPGTHPVVFLDLDSTTLLLEHPRDTTAYTTLADTLDTLALSPHATHHHLADLASDLR